jgi:hypothetical protein
MLLGNILKDLKDEQNAEVALVSLGDLVLVAAVDQARKAHDETLGEYVSGAAQRFARLASDEEWLQLMTAVEKSDNPASACLSVMLNWSVERDKHEQLGGLAKTKTCSCGGAGGCHEHR